MLMLTIILGTMVAVLMTAIVRAFVLSYLWAWFFVPLGLHPIGVGMAMGIALTVSVLTAHHQPDSGPKEEAMDRLFKSIGWGVVGPLFALGIGAIIHVAIS